jgi:hypothetical protein
MVHPNMKVPIVACKVYSSADRIMGREAQMDAGTSHHAMSIPTATFLNGISFIGCTLACPPDLSKVMMMRKLFLD